MRLSDLNAPQREAVTTIKGPVLILAGAGTGKTRVITTRICHLLEKGVRPEQILAVTFTNKAAREMVERVEHMTPKGTVKRITISTFHSLCVKILRRDIDKLGYKKNFAIYTGSEQLSLVRRIIVKKAGKGEKLDPDVAISLISRERNKGIPAAPQADALINVVKHEYLHQLKLLNAVDFDDLLLLAEKILQKHPEVREAWQSRYEYLMVDEFQDTNRLQMELIRHLTGPHHNICVVGDDDQSIYGWRGAEIANILQFERFFKNPSVIKLEENYRSTDVILGAANGLIKNNLDRRAKQLWSSKKSADMVRLISMPGEQEEADFVIEDMMVMKDRDNLKFDDFAILFRTNAQTRVFEEGLRKNKIPYRIIGGRSFFDRREIKDVMAYLAILVNPDDDINLLRIINTPPRGLSDVIVENATLASQERKESVYKTLISGAFQSTLSKRAQGAIQAFQEFVSKWQGFLSEGYPTLAEMTQDMVTHFNTTYRGDFLRRPEWKLSPTPKVPGKSAAGFVKQHTAAAEQAAAQTGIPAPFMLAQAALETGWGKREIIGRDGSNSHNLFGIKAGGSWTGPTVDVTTTEYIGGQPRKLTQTFRAYASEAESFADYAKLMKDSPRYAKVVERAADAKAFAMGLQKAGYATDPLYGDKLGKVINTTLRLQRDMA